MVKDIELTETSVIELHGFCDTSICAYAACIYLCIQMPKTVETRLITAKTHISLLKGETIPRLELIAASLLAELVSNVSTVLKEITAVNTIY